MSAHDIFWWKAARIKFLGIRKVIWILMSVERQKYNDGAS
jgi:hypothetical protein